MSHTPVPPCAKTKAERRHVVGLLVRDLSDTVGPEYASKAVDVAARVAQYANPSAPFEEQLVDDLQQMMHDEFIDTTWPACPDHPNHPLVYETGWWRCPKTGRQIAMLGELARAAAPSGE